MKPIACKFAIVLALLGALLPSMAKAQSLQTAALRSDGIAWITQPQDILQALHQAEAEGSPVMIYFHDDRCPYCQEMEENTFSDDDVQALSERFTCIRIDADSDLGKRLMAQLGITDVPYVLFYNNNSKVNTVDGYEGPSAFARDMRMALYSGSSATL